MTVCGWRKWFLVSRLGSEPAVLGVAPWGSLPGPVVLWTAAERLGFTFAQLAAETTLIFVLRGVLIFVFGRGCHLIINHLLFF